MSTFKCKMCGGTLEIQNGATVAECEYCGAKQTLPRLDDEKRINLYDRANHFRRSNEFDKAIAIYEQILNEDGTDAEAFWSLVLCQYGVEYVEDPLTHKRVPTIHRAQFTSIFDDDNYKMALKNADAYQRVIYEEEAVAINEIQKGFLSISSKEEPFDVFICYKETGSDGKRTHDSVMAQDLFYQLKQEGFKVFFARITLEDKLGSAYEPYIFAALNSSKVMVTIGTKPEHFNAVWVKNEWSRFLSLIKQGEKKVLIPAYKDMDPYDLPQEFSHLQAQDMAKLGFMQDLIRGIKKILGRDQKPAAPVTERIVVQDARMQEAAPLLRRAFLFLEDEEYEEADEYAEKVLDVNPECAEAYVIKLLAELRIPKPEQLENYEEPLSDIPNYQKAVRFASPEYKETIEGYNRAIIKRIDTALKEEVYNYGIELIKLRRYDEAIANFQKILAYKDAEQMVEECQTLKEHDRLDAIYTRATTLLKNKQFDEAAKLFGSITEYKDAQQLVESCVEQKLNARKDAVYARAMKRVATPNADDVALKQSITELQAIAGYKDVDDCIRALSARLDKWNADKAAAEEAARIKAEEERRTRERLAELKRIKKEKRKKTAKKVVKIGSPIAAGVAIFLLLLFTLIIPLIRYNQAETLFNEGKYADAMLIYEDLGGFSKSEQRATILSGIDNINQGNFDDGIKKILSAGVPVKLTYGMDGGDFSGEDYLDASQANTDNVILLNSSTEASVPETLEYTFNSSSDFTGVQTPDKLGYHFAAWALETFTYQLGGTFEMKLNVVWAENMYTIEYDLGGGQNDASNLSKYGIEFEAFTLVAPKKAGYTFTGWTGTDLSAPTMSVTIPKGSVGNKQYKANWVANTYTLTLDADGGTVSPATQTVTYNASFTLPTPVKSGYTFAGWYNGTTKVESGNWNIASNATLKAMWTANTYTVIFDDIVEEKKTVTVTLNYNYSGSKSSTVTLKNGDTLSYPTVPTRSGYAFVGWYTNSACTTPYNFSGTITSDKTLYAKWTSMISSGSSSEYVDIKNYTSSSNAKSYSVTASYSSSPNYYYFTCYKTGSYTFYASHSSGDYYITVYNVTQETTIRSSYNLYDSRPNTSATFSANAGDVIYVKLYKYSSYSSTGSGTFYVTDAGYPTSTAKASVKIGTGYIYDTSSSITKKITFGTAQTFPTLTKAHYTFLGWYNGNTKVEPGNWSIASDVTLTPKWQANQNTITLDANGGTVSSSSVVVSYEQSYTLPTPTRTGYTFEGWYNGTTKHTAGVWKSEADLKLTAKWKANTYKVTFTDTQALGNDITVKLNYNYSGATNTKATLKTGQTLPYPTVPTRDGYAFAGWYTDSACTKLYNFSGTITSDITLYAGWVSMVSSYRGRDYIDIANYTSSSKAYSFYIYSSDSYYSTYYYYYYFTCYKSGTYTFSLNTSSGSYGGLYVGLYNATTGSTITSSDYVSSYGGNNSTTFTANAGDVIRVRLYTSSSYSDANGSFYVTGAGYPTSTAKAQGSASGFLYDSKSTYVADVPYDSNLTLPTPTRTGYTLLGWYNGNTKVESGKWTTTSNVTLTPKWTITKNTITLDANGGTASSSSVKTTYGESYTLPTPTRTGYTFEGWYDGSTKYTSGVWKNESDLKLTAKWKANTYQVTFSDTLAQRNDITVKLNYNYSGATNAKATLKAGQTLPYPTPPTRTGYAFAGWYTDSACTKAYDFTGTITDDLTLYAKWTAMTSSYYSREYVDISKHTTSSSAKSFSLYVSSYTSYGGYYYYYFTCYKTGSYAFYTTSTDSCDFYVQLYNETTGSTLISSDCLSSSGASTSKTFTANAGDVIRVRLNAYNSSYYYSDYAYGSFYVTGAEYPTSTAKVQGSASDFLYDSTSTYTATVTFGSNYTLPTPTRAGYTLLGWYKGETKVSSGNWNIASDVTLTPKWTITKNTITLDANGGTVSSSSVKTTYGESYTLPTPTRTGYTFEGWYDGSTKYTSGVWTGNADLKLTAKWKANTYKVTFSEIKEAKADVVVRFNPNYSGSTTSKITLKTGQTLPYPTVPTRTGYAFAGWYTDSACKNLYNFSGTITADMTLYAKWTAMTSSYSSREYVDIKNYNSSSSKKAYTVTSSTEASAHYYYFTCYTTGSYTFYADWGSGDYYITLYNVTKETDITNYNMYSSSSSKSSTFSANAGDVIYVKLYNLSSGSTGTGSFYVSGANYPTSTAKAQSDTFVYPYDTQSTYVVNVTYDSKFTLPTPTRAGYTFAGWYNGNNKVDSGNWKIASDVTLTAKWTKN